MTTATEQWLGGIFFAEVLVVFWALVVSPEWESLGSGLCWALHCRVQCFRMEQTDQIWPKPKGIKNNMRLDFLVMRNVYFKYKGPQKCWEAGLRRAHNTSGNTAKSLSPRQAAFEPVRESRTQESLVEKQLLRTLKVSIKRCRLCSVKTLKLYTCKLIKVN